MLLGKVFKCMSRRGSQHDDNNDRESVDFSNATLYLPAVQLIVVTMAVCGANMAMVTLPPRWAVTALRTLTVLVVVAVVGTWRPIQIGNPRGVMELFRASKVSVWLYVAALVVEQLRHACTHHDCAGPVDRDERGGYMLLGGYVIEVLMLIGGSFQSYAHISTDDILPLIVVALCIVALALMPEQPSNSAAPFCDEVSLFEAAGRMLRACTFASLYVIHAFLCIGNEQRYITTDDVITAAIRATGASVWTLCCPVVMLVCAPFQASLGVYRRSSFERHVVNAVDDARNWIPIPFGCDTSDDEPTDGVLELTVPTDGMQADSARSVSRQEDTSVANTEVGMDDSMAVARSPSVGAVPPASVQCANERAATAEAAADDVPDHDNEPVDTPQQQTAVCANIINFANIKMRDHVSGSVPNVRGVGRQYRALREV